MIDTWKTTGIQTHRLRFTGKPVAPPVPKCATSKGTSHGLRSWRDDPRNACGYRRRLTHQAFSSARVAADTRNQKIQAMPHPLVTSVQTNDSFVGGNHFDKYRSKNPIHRMLMRGFLSSAKALLSQADFESVARVAKRSVWISVPWEPAWRVVNMARGKYWSRFGNTLGHVQHFSRRAICTLIEAQVELSQLRHPFPWTIVLGKRKGST